MALPKITSAFLNLTNACCLACKYCFVHQSPEHMTLQVAKDAADFLAANAKAQGETPSINFFGGEPMLRYERVIVPLTLYIRDTYGDHFNLSITSNGMLFTEERLSFMKEHGIALLFSMDGGREVQDVNRPRADGGSSFETLEKAIPLILQYYPEVMFRATVTEETQDKLFDSIMFAERQGFQTFFVMPDCFAVWKATHGLYREMRKYSEHYINCLRGGVTPIYFSQLEKYFPRIRQYNRAVTNNIMRDFDGCKSCGKCGLGSNKFAGININGDVTSCQEFFSRTDDKFLIGNIYTGINDDLRTQLIAEFDSSPVYGDNCGTCPLNRICVGGCVANNYMITGDIHHVPDIYCHWERLLFGEAVYIMQVLGEERNEAFAQRWCMA